MLDETAICVVDATASVGLALRFIDRIQQACMMLARNPNAGVWRPEFGPGIRSASVERHTIFYRLCGADVWILLVIHSARDIPLAGRRMMKNSMLPV